MSKVFEDLLKKLLEYEVDFAGDARVLEFIEEAGRAAGIPAPCAFRLNDEDLEYVAAAGDWTQRAVPADSLWDAGKDGDGPE